MSHSICVPRFNANDDEVLLGQWLVGDGDYVSAGTTLCVIETSKSVHDLIAEADGYLHIDMPDGRQVQVQQVIGRLTAGADAEADTHLSDTILTPKAGSRHHAPADADPPRLTEKARRLAEQLGVNPADIVKKGIIREKDIQQHHDRQQATEPVVQSATTSAPPPGDAVLPTAPPLPGENAPGRMDLEFLEYIRRDREAFGRLSSEFKVWQYRRHGAAIGDGVTIGPGTTLDAEVIHIGDGCRIDGNVLIKCHRFIMGTMGEIGADSKVLCRDFVAGDVVVIRFRSVFVGGGLHSCRVGDNTFIAYDTYINTDRDVVIGKHVCLSPGVKLYTHRKWLSPLEGYSTAFQSVQVGDHCHLGPNAVVLPGARLGPRVTVMANSVVSDLVEGDQLIGGIPARPLVDRASYHRRLTREQKIQVALRVLRDTVASLRARGICIDDCVETDEECAFELIHGNARLAVRFAPEYPQEVPQERVALLSFDPAVLDAGRNHITAFDLTHHVVRGRRDAVADLLRDQLSRLGVEFEPMCWRPMQPGENVPDAY